MQNSSSIRILIVDDDPVITKVFSSLISQTGFYADTFKNADEAYLHLASHLGRYDLLITDICMAPTDGISFAKKVRQIAPNLPILFMTGNATAELRQQALAMGRVDFLEKPFPLVRALQEMISKFIANS